MCYPNLIDLKAQPRPKLFESSSIKLREINRNDWGEWWRKIAEEVKFLLNNQCNIMLKSEL